MAHAEIYRSPQRSFSVQVQQETVGICWVFIALAMGRSIPEKVELTSSSFGTLPGQRAAA